MSVEALTNPVDVEQRWYEDVRAIGEKHGLAIEIGSYLPDSEVVSPDKRSWCLMISAAERDEIIDRENKERLTQRNAYSDLYAGSFVPTDYIPWEFVANDPRTHWAPTPEAALSAALDAQR